MNITKAIERFDKLSNDWLVDLKMLDPDVLQINPDSNTWSLAEVYDHCMKVARTYQIPNLRKSLTEAATRKRGKNLTGVVIFDFEYRRNVHMKMEEFPNRFVKLFSPVKRVKEDLVEDFTLFIHEVKSLEDLVLQSRNSDKQYHPMFGDISAREWYYLIEFHLWQHNKQKEKIKNYLRTGELCFAC